MHDLYAVTGAGRLEVAIPFPQKVIKSTSIRAKGFFLTILASLKNNSTIITFFTWEIDATKGPRKSDPQLGALDFLQLIYSG